MVSKLAFFSNLLLASVATMAIISSQPGARLALGEGLQLQPSNRDVSESNEASDSSAGIVPDTTYNMVWAGAQVARIDMSFKAVAATFTVPYASSASRKGGILIWVGVGGPRDPTCNVVFVTGLRIRIILGLTVYSVMYQWYPDKAKTFPTNSIVPGDTVTLTIIIMNLFEGTAIIVDHTQGWMVAYRVNSTNSLCYQRAHWMVENIMDSDSLLPFPNFGKVDFRNTVASQPGTSCNGPNNPEGCNVGDATQVYDIQQNNVKLTNTTISRTLEPVLTIKYEGPDPGHPV